MKRKYEVIIALDSKIKESDVERVVDKIKSVVKNSDGEILKSENQGRKKLAFQIKGRDEAIFQFMEINIDNNKVSELERNCRVSDFILRYAIVKKLSEKVKGLVEKEVKK